MVTYITFVARVMGMIFYVSGPMNSMADCQNMLQFASRDKIAFVQQHMGLPFGMDPNDIVMSCEVHYTKYIIDSEEEDDY